MTGERDALTARWLHLTRVILPAMAAEQNWPIRLDHCFMRVCLDASCGCPWFAVIPRPAIAHASDEILQKAVDVAERCVREPETLPVLNAASLAMRGKGTARR